MFLIAVNVVIEYLHMENFDYQKNRKELKDILINSPKGERGKILGEAKKTDEYKKAREFKIQTAKREENSPVLLNKQREKLGLQPRREKLSELSRENLQALQRRL